MTTGLAALFVFLALATPDQITRLPPDSYLPYAFVRLPIEGILAGFLLILLPHRARRPVATGLGLLLGLIVVVKAVDMGFWAALSRPFDPVLDWILFRYALKFLAESFGDAGAIGALIGAAVLAVVAVVAATLSVRRLARVVPEQVHAPLGVTALTSVWVVCALLGAQLIPGLSIAAGTAAALVHDKALLVPAGVRDRAEFSREIAVDAFAQTPGEQLLTGLRGKDVVLAFIESYGRDAVEDPEYATQVGGVLADGHRRLSAAGYGSRSGWLTSPTAGGGSWLAHSTLLSGLWIDNEQRYRRLVASDRLSLTRAFRLADWRTVGVEPGITYAWPEGAYYGYHQVYDSHTLGYQGPTFGFATMPDQYTLSAFQRLEYAKPGRGPLLAEMTFVSSHTPWAPLPRLIDWDAVGDGSIYRPMAQQGESADAVWGDTVKVRAAYRAAVEYSLASLISWVQTYGDEDLVVIFLGDHQPAALITGDDASRDVPITIIARDPAVLDRVADWGWQDGLAPAPQSPVWRMDAFRDRFLTAFGPRAG
ncbi:MAG TPA: sulfatase [Actinoplanes sp.]|nr:sulfatase [Actinoplanes sp.]